MKTQVDLRDAFPRELRDVAAAAIERMPEFGIETTAGRGFVRVAGELLSLPGRIYHAEPPEVPADQREALVLHCLYTRHHDGFVRQRHLEPIVQTDTPWALPYVLQLVGEYVLEITRVIEMSAPLEHVVYQAFVAENPEFCATLRRRVTSYWNCYYRQTPQSAYPAFRILGRLGV